MRRLTALVLVALLLASTAALVIPASGARAASSAVSLTTGSIEGQFFKGERPHHALADYGVTLRIFDGKTTTLVGSRTDANGSFRYDNLAPGSYTLYATNGNYTHDYRDDIVVTAGQVTRIEMLVPYEWANWVQWSTQIYGDDRYATAAEVSRQSFAAGVRVAFIASGAAFADALSAAPAAARWDSPLLLTAPADLPRSVAAELARLKPQKIIVVGGEMAVAAGVERQLAQYAPLVERVAGADRYDTAVKIAETQFEPCDEIHVATGRDFPDALSAGARAGRRSGPLLLIDGLQSRIPESVANYLSTAGCRSAYVVGGSSVLREDVVEDLGGRLEVGTKRIGGADRYETSRLANEGASFKHVYFASGENFPDALAAAAQAGGVNAPLYLASKTCLSPAIQRDIRAGSNGQYPAETTTIGGPNAIWQAHLDWPNYYRC